MNIKDEVIKRRTEVISRVRGPAAGGTHTHTSTRHMEDITRRMELDLPVQYKETQKRKPQFYSL